MEPVRTVVEIATRGKLVVGEPYFEPGVPVVLDRKSLRGAERGELAVVVSGRGRAKVERVLGPAERVDAVLEGLLVERGARQRVRAVRAAGADDRGPHRPSRPDHLHDRPRHGEGLRRRDLGPPRGGRGARVGAHRRRLVLRRGRLAARSRRGRPRVLDVCPGSRRADAPAGALGGPVLAAAARRPPDGHGRVPAGRRRAELLPLGDRERRAPDLRPGAAARRAARGGRGARARRRVLGRAPQAPLRPRRASRRAAGARLRVRREGRCRAMPAGRASPRPTRSSRS